MELSAVTFFSPALMGAVLAVACLRTPAGAPLTAEQSAILHQIARGQAVSAWPALSKEQVRDLERKAEAYFRDYRRYHQPYGTTADILFTDDSRSSVEMLDGIGDSATWTGHYLAALAFRYSVTRESALLDEIRKVLDAYEALTHVTGRDGYIARFAGPAQDEAYRRYYRGYGRGPDPARPGLGTWAYRGVGRYSDLVWLGNSSCDVYIGVNLGLATAYRLVPEEEIRNRIRTLVKEILARLIADDWMIVDGQGHTTPCTPSLIVSLLRTGATVNPGQYGALYEEKAGPFLDSPVPRATKYSDYYPNNLLYATYYVLTTLETDPARRARYLEKMRAIWQQSQDHLNAYFAAAYLSATGDTADPVALATLQGVLYDFPPPPRWAKQTDNSTRTDIAFYTDPCGQKWAKYALPIRERASSDFMWQRSPFSLTDSGVSTLAYPGIDVFLPYWMGRACGAIPGTSP